jgi:predicted transcriptional regulator
MSEMQLGVIEARFADIIWKNEPVPSSAIVKLAEKELGWKKSTTYTVLKRLCEKGIFKNEGSTVSSLISKSEFYALQSERFVEETFSGSLPAFIAAFTKRKALSADEIEEIRRLIDEHAEG